MIGKTSHRAINSGGMQLVNSMKIIYPIQMLCINQFLTFLCLRSFCLDKEMVHFQLLTAHQSVQKRIGWYGLGKIVGQEKTVTWLYGHFYILIFYVIEKKVISMPFL